MEKLLTTKEVAEILGIKVQTLRKWRMLGGGKSLPYVRLGSIKSRCMYRKEDVDRWVSEHTMSSTTEETLLSQSEGGF